MHMQLITSVCLHIKLFSLGTSFSKVYKPCSLPAIVERIHRDMLPAKEEKREIQTLVPSDP